MICGGLRFSPDRTHVDLATDGNTVFVAGDSNLVVVPVANAVLTQKMRPALSKAAQKVGRGATVPWNLNL